MFVTFPRGATTLKPIASLFSDATLPPPPPCCPPHHITLRNSRMRTMQQARVSLHLSETSVVERQAEWTKSHNERLAALVRSAEAEEREACPFSPAISAASRLSERSFLPQDVRSALAASAEKPPHPKRPSQLAALAPVSAALRQKAGIDAFVDRLALARVRAEADAAHAIAVFSTKKSAAVTGPARTIPMAQALAVASGPKVSAPTPNSVKTAAFRAAASAAPHGSGSISAVNDVTLGAEVTRRPELDSTLPPASVNDVAPNGGADVPRSGRELYLPSGQVAFEAQTLAAANLNTLSASRSASSMIVSPKPVQILWRTKQTA